MPHYIRDPNRDHNFDNHPYAYLGEHLCDWLALPASCRRTGYGHRRTLPFSDSLHQEMPSRCIRFCKDSKSYKTRPLHRCSAIKKDDLLSRYMWLDPLYGTVLAEQNSNPTTPHSLTRPQNPSAASEAPRLESPWRK